MCEYKNWLQKLILYQKGLFQFKQTVKSRYWDLTCKSVFSRNLCPVVFEKTEIWDRTEIETELIHFLTGNLFVSS